MYHILQINFFNHCILCIYLLHFLVPLIYSTLRLLPTFKLWIAHNKQYRLIVPVPVFSPFKYIPTSRELLHQMEMHTYPCSTLCVSMSMSADMNVRSENNLKSWSLFNTGFLVVCQCTHQGVWPVNLQGLSVSLCHPSHHGS